MKKFLLVDTNNFIQPTEEGFKQIEIEKRDLEELLNLLNGEKITLLLPDIIEIEYKRIFGEKKKELEKIFNEQKKKIDIKSERTKSEIKKSISEILKKELLNLKQINKIIGEIFKSPKTQVINLDSGTLVSSFKRSVSGKKPFSKEKAKLPSGFVTHAIQPDIVIIELVKNYLVREKDYQLIICTNDPDFWDDEKKKIDSSILEEFNEVRLFKSLRECLRNEFAAKLPPISIAIEKPEELEKDQKTPPVPIEVLIDELEKTGSFDEARKNMKNILSYKSYLNNDHLKKILKAMFSNPYNYTINQVIAVDREQEFSKSLYLSFKEEKEIWVEFADDLKLFYGNKYQYLEEYSWLFDRLGINYKKTNEIKPEDIPF